ncbi:MAG: N-formylglutamate deformylase [Halioglobus sp.]|jgi:N-formylglutamate deformylase
MELFSHKEGNSAVIVSMPHSGTFLPKALTDRFTEKGLAVADTDWHIPQLYNFLEALNVTVIQANYSRYVIDLNRSVDGRAMYPGQTETGLCPHHAFSGESLYLPGVEIVEGEVSQRAETYWQPYHRKMTEEIERLKALHGFVIVWDAHSIRSSVPRLFSGQLPDLNLGTANGQSCAPELEKKLNSLLLAQDRFSTVCNGRFTGGAITRHYGQPASNVHAVQMEIAQKSYMRESADFLLDEGRAAELRPLLREMILALTRSGLHKR